LKEDIAMKDESITEILINHFGKDKTLREVGLDYEALQREIKHERSANGEGSRRLAALIVLERFQIKLVLEKLVDTPDNRGKSPVPME
jgi:hypothetical protein